MAKPFKALFGMPTSHNSVARFKFWFCTWLQLLVHPGRKCNGSSHGVGSGTGVRWGDGDLAGGPNSQLQPGPATDIRQRRALSLSPSVCFSNRYSWMYIQCVYKRLNVCHPEKDCDAFLMDWTLCILEKLLFVCLFVWAQSCMTMWFVWFVSIALPAWLWVALVL